ncbi:CRISPR-associated protein Csx19 [Mitsuokella sp. WILCCON 0060]|uniref:type III-D CRISPR-associated protein Csx19 n=1 Tax=Mitsuokella sp. WILCCON 0060 TaxID=3345341 RepID=UPI003F1DAA35
MNQEFLKINSGKRLVRPVSISKVETLLTALLQHVHFTEGTVVVWQVDKIRWGKWADGKFTFADGQPENIKLWLECRVFNEQAELHLTSRKLRLSGHLVEDGQGEPAEYVDACSRFWGECQEKDADWMTLHDEDRKLSQKMPAVADEARFYGLVTRNYIGINEKTGQAGYVDYRYLAVRSADQKGDA